ncbi:MAG: hypothetical protein KatS3mg031_2728 [Chitinophagales bacterium]|nr:MAG: hypothetical protein KatS3mg031_2728 [Chitinophagales bacterium]
MQIWFLIGLLLAGLMSAAGSNLQNHKHSPASYLPDLNAQRLCRSYFPNEQLPGEGNAIVEEVVSFLKKNYSSFQIKYSEPVLLFDITSPGGRHLTFEQYFAGVPVFDSQVKVNLDKQNRIRSVFDNAWPAHSWNPDALKASYAAMDESHIVTFSRKNYGIDTPFVRSRKGIAVVNDTPRILVEIEWWDMEANTHFLMWTDETLQVYMKRDLNVYFSDSLVTAQAMVFIPDPLTSAQRFYGPPYIDAEDADVPELNAERKPVSVLVTYDGTAYRLENPWVLIYNLSPPDSAPVVSQSPYFDFTRSRSGFEDANAFYHLAEFNRYVHSLGFDSLANFQVIADPHAGTQDNSAFTPGAFGPQLTFGTGGVDDAEDADVIIHEYAHALSHRAAPFTNNGHERKSVDEGIGDYFATSYSRNISAFRWADMFTWDGHNESEPWGWPGRTALTHRVYALPDTMLNYSIHDNGQILNHALMLIWEQIGKEKTDKLVLQMLYSLASNMRMGDAALLLFDADSALFQGANYCVIFHALMQKGFIDSFGVQACKVLDTRILADAGEDRVLCFGEQTEIGKNTMAEPGYSYQWKPAVGLSDAFAPMTKAAPEATTRYILTVTAFDGRYNTDTVEVRIESCEVQLTVLPETAILTFPPQSADNAIALYDVSGKRLLQVEGISDNQYAFSIRMLPAGIYLLRAKTNRGTQTLKLKKLR